jgi:UDPglucose--hexose-1-phosphate uridylyltransferase
MNGEPQFRRDPITGRWAVIAPERARRPIALEGHGPRHRANGEPIPCPFCAGQEHQTTDELLAYRDAGSAPDGPGWHLRVVANMYPAVRQCGPTPPAPLPEGRGESEHGSFPPSLQGVGLFTTAPGFGRAEVLIECPHHTDDPTQLTDEQLRDVFRAYRERMLAHAADPRLAHVAVFKNVGAEAGASLGHTHSQIIATPIVPELVREELAGAEAHFARTGRCVFCDLVQQELADGSRVVARSAGFVAVAAFAPRFAYEVWVLPLAHEPRYETLSDPAALELALLVKRLLRALDAAQNAPAYNWILHTTPLRAGEPPHYHWHLEILPRTARPAGFEWGHGCHITTVAPEQAAAELRAALPESR